MGWLCDGCLHMYSAKDAEHYLRSCVPKAASVSVKVVHCYDEWKTSKGLRVQVGSGLTAEQVGTAQAFLTSSRTVRTTSKVEDISKGQQCLKQSADKENQPGAPSNFNVSIVRKVAALSFNP